MLPKTKGTRQSGFSLVELMIVVAIIGLLAALAVPRFQSFQAKARQSEAKNNLSHMYTLAQSYYGENDTFKATIATIGFRTDGGATKTRYNYDYSGEDTTFTGTATAKKSILPGCSGSDKDKWTINEKKELIPVVDEVTKCNQ